MKWFETVLISLLYYCGSSFWLDGWLTVNHPFIGGFLTGCIMGQPDLGAFYGAYIQLMFMGWMRMGGNDNIDSCFGGVVATALAISCQLDLATTLLLAYLLSHVTKYVWNLRNIENGKLMPKADKAAQRGDSNTICLLNTWAPQSKLLMMTVLPCAICLLLIEPILCHLYPKLSTPVLAYLSTIGKMLPVLGIGATLKLSFTKKNVFFFILGALICLFDFINLFNAEMICLLFALIILAILWKDKKIRLPKRRNAYCKINRLDILYADIKMYFLQYQSVNYERYQALGFVQSVSHILKKLYTKETINEPLVRYGKEAYNIEPYSGTELMGAVIAMEEDKTVDHSVTEQEISDFKNFMVSPISAIGDQMNQYLGNTILLLLGVGCTLSTHFDGGPVALILMVGVYLIQSIYFAYKGYVYGKDYILNLMQSRKLDTLIEIETSLLLLFIGMMAVRTICFDVMGLLGDFGEIAGVMAALGCYYLYSKNCRPIVVIIIIMVVGLSALI